MTDVAIDTSAIVELLTRGPQAASVRQTIDDAERVLVTPVAHVEAAFVLMGRFGWIRAEFDRGWNTLGLTDVVVDQALAGLAIDAFEAWGKGRASAALNFGDCFSHALAVARGAPLLFIGNDFSQTELPKA